MGIRSAALLVVLLAAPAVRAQTGPPPPAPASEPWRPPPGFFTGWARAGAFFPATPDFTGARTQTALGVGFGVDVLPFATAAAEASFTDRDFADPNAGGGRIVVQSRGLALLARLHHRLWRLEPGVTVGGVWMETRLASTGAFDSFAARSRDLGLVAGAGLDLLLIEGFSMGVDWRWLQARGHFPDRHGPAVSLAGHSLGGLIRVFWP